MFRRKRSASQHRPNLSTSSSQSAQSAATRAFLQSQPSSNNLSSAAAAAALRTLTPTPTPVENVQTKRMLQRKSSISSQPATSGSPILRPSSRNGLRRVNSSGSMSARTFRDQSPGRPTSSYGTPGAPAVAPPLPAIPKEFSGRNNQSRRSVSLGPNVWSSNPRTQAAEERASDINPLERLSDSPTHGARKPSPEHQRSESRNSINFSYPMNSRANSPTIPSGFPDRREEVIAGGRNGRSTSEEASHNKRPLAEPAKAVRQQTHGASPASPGSPVRNQRTAGTALLAAQAAIVHRLDEPNTPPMASRPTRQLEQAVAVERSPSRSPASVDTARRPLVKKPSTITEERQPKERLKLEPSTPLKVPAVPASPTQLPRPQTPPVVEKPKEHLKTPPVSPSQPHLAVELDGGSPPPNLRQSASSGRSARFPSQLAVMSLPGEHLHQPPPRSVSPAKSALKRNSSLSPDGRVHGILRPGPPLSELSDATSVASDDGSRIIRKKSVKVSFDDEAEVVGVAADPPTPPEDPIPESPPGKSKPKSNWFNLHKRKSSPKRSPDVSELDGILKPRAALPSFGSIRAGRDGSKPEPLPQDLDDDESTSSDEDDHVGFSNDHGIGSIISPTAHENMQKQVPVDSALPATTHIAARDATEAREENISIGESNSEPAFFHKTPLSPLQEVPSEQNLRLEPELTLETPNITLQPATPELEKGRQSLDEYDEAAEYPQPPEEVESKSDHQKKGKRKSFGESDDDSSDSVYSDAEEGYDGDGFASINAILDRESAPEHSAAVKLELDTSSKDGGHQADEAGDELPATCQIAHVDSPTLDDSRRSTSGSPELIEPLSVAPTHAQLEPERTVSQGESPRPSTMPVEVYTIAHVQDEDDLKKVDKRFQQPETNTYSAPKPRDHDKKRPSSLAPSTHKEIDAPNGEVNGNGPDAYMPRRTLSNGSDSSSSFTRVRRPSRGGMVMRRTLRGSQTSSSVPASPVESRPLPSGLGAGTMRTTLRGSGPRKDKPSLFSTGKSPKGKSARGSGTPFRSRFEDSDSDSDGGVQNRLIRHRPTRSMSDNDMRPVRGIPRRKGAHDGDSTELEDSSEGEGRPSSAPRTPARRAQRAEPTHDEKVALAALARSRGMTEQELDDLLNRGSTGSSRKPTLLNRLSLRKSKSPVQRGKLQPPGLAANGTISEYPQPPVQGFEGNDSYKATITANPASPSRLLKRSPRKPASDAWPLGSEQGDPIDSGIGSTLSPSTTQQPQRPATSDGVSVNGNKANSNNPQSGPNDDQSAVNGHRASDVVIEGSGRKKRFQRLRNAFKMRG